MLEIIIKGIGYGLEALGEFLLYLTAMVGFGKMSDAAVELQRFYMVM